MSVTAAVFGYSNREAIASEIDAELVTTVLGLTSKPAFKLVF
jgi:hypothetical protein